MNTCIDIIFVDFDRTLVFCPINELYSFICKIFKLEPKIKIYDYCSKIDYYLSFRIYPELWKFLEDKNWTCITARHHSRNICKLLRKYLKDKNHKTIYMAEGITGEKKAKYFTWYKRTLNKHENILIDDSGYQHRGHKLTSYYPWEVKKDGFYES